MLEREDFRQLPKIRQDLGLPPEEHFGMLREYMESFIRIKPTLAPEVKRKVLDGLKSARTDLKQQGLAASRAAVSAAWVFSLKNQFLDEGVKMLRDDIPAVFILYYDYALGFGNVVGEISEAADKEHELTDKTIADSVVREIDTFGLQVSTGEAADRYLDMKSDVERNAKLLKEDPTGFLLADDIVNIIRQAKDFVGSDMVVEYVLAGAEDARSLYQQVYGIAGPFFSDSLH